MLFFVVFTPSPPRPPGSEWLLAVIVLRLTNSVSRVQASLSKWSERFRRNQKEDERWPFGINSSMPLPNDLITTVCTLRNVLILPWKTLKGVWHEIFDFFHESVIPWPLSILLGQFLICTKISGDIRNFVFIKVVHRCQRHRQYIIAGVVITGDKFLIPFPYILIIPVSPLQNITIVLKGHLQYSLDNPDLMLA